MWTNTAFDIYMGQHDAVTAAEFEPARRREVLLDNLAATECTEAVERSERTSGRFGLGSIGMSARTAGRRLVRG